MQKSAGNFVPLAARILMSSMFLWSGMLKIMAYPLMVGYSTSKGLPLAGISVGIAAAIEILGGLAILTGFHMRAAAWILFVYLIPVTILFHNYWAMQGGVHMDTHVHFMKNMAILGGLLLLAHFGAGDFAFDSAGNKNSQEIL